jgi:hypothetical protein
MGLQLSQEKTHITPIADGFNFLCQHTSMYAKGKLLTRPTKKAQANNLKAQGKQCSKNDFSSQSGHHRIGKLPQARML